MRNYFEFGPAQMLLKDFFISSSGGHFVWRSGIVCLNVGKGPYEEHLGEIIINLDKQIGRCG